MFRVNDCSMPTDHNVHCINSIEKMKDTTPKPRNNDPDNSEPPKPTPHEEYEIDDRTDPNPRLGKKYITSPVGTIGPKPTITRYTNVIEIDGARDTAQNDPTEPPSGKNPDDLENEETKNQPASSGDPSYSQDSKNVKSLELKEKPTADLLPPNLQEMANALIELISIKDSKIDSVLFIDNEASEHIKPTAVAFTSIELKPKYIKKWHILKKEKDEKGNKKSILRKFLIAKIIFTDKISGYLLEIQTRHSESFFSLFFNTNTAIITPDILKKLLIAVMKNEGRYTTRSTPSKSTSSSAPKTLEPLPVDSMMYFKHYGKTITAAQLARAIERGIKNEIFH